MQRFCDSLRRALPEGVRLRRSGQVALNLGGWAMSIIGRKQSRMLRGRAPARNPGPAQRGLPWISAATIV
jgi:hypothetical protein